MELGAGVEAGRQLVGLQLLVILPSKKRTMFIGAVYTSCLLFLASINFWYSRMDL